MVGEQTEQTAHVCRMWSRSSRCRVSRQRNVTFVHDIADIAQPRGCACLRHDEAWGYDVGGSVSAHHADNGLGAEEAACLANAFSSMTRLTSLNLQGKHAFAILSWRGFCMRAE